MLAGCLALLAGIGITIAAIVTSSAAVFLIGTTVAGVGYGLGFQGAFRALSALAKPDQRAALVATIYIVAYLAFGVPVVIAGIATTKAGLHDTSIVYATVLGALVAAVTVSLFVRRRAHPSGESQHGSLTRRLTRKVAWAEADGGDPCHQAAAETDRSAPPRELFGGRSRTRLRRRRAFPLPRGHAGTIACPGRQTGRAGSSA